MKVELISWTHNPLETIAQAASQCYNSEPSLKIVKKCIQNQHLSVLEMANFTFEVSGVSRALLAQLTRHRTGSYCVRSQRYCTEDNFEYATPISISANQKALEIYKKFMEESRTAYTELIEIGIPKEDARYVLTNACNTKLVLTFDLRNLAHFENVRLCAHAQQEIRALALAMKREIINKIAPLCGDARDILEMLFVPRCETNKIAFCPEHKSCGRHCTAEEINKSIKNLKIN